MYAKDVLDLFVGDGEQARIIAILVSAYMLHRTAKSIMSHFEGSSTNMFLNRISIHEHVSTLDINRRNLGSTNADSYSCASLRSTETTVVVFKTVATTVVAEQKNTVTLVTDISKSQGHFRKIGKWVCSVLPVNKHSAVSVTTNGRYFVSTFASHYSMLRD